MSTLAVVDKNGKKIKDLELVSDLWEGDLYPKLVHESVRCYRAAQRQGNAATKTRGMIAGTSAKPWKQKGTGRARSGSRKSPVWRGGGTIFGPQPRLYRFQLPKKVKRLALLTMIRSRYKEQQCFVIDQLSFDQPKTKDMVALLSTLGLGAKVLIVTKGVTDINILRSAANLAKVSVKESQIVNTFDMISHDQILFTEEGVLDFQDRLMGTGEAVNV